MNKIKYGTHRSKGKYNEYNGYYHTHPKRFKLKYSGNKIHDRKKIASRPFFIKIEDRYLSIYMVTGCYVKAKKESA
jgi:hypothetical protein